MTNPIEPARQSASPRRPAVFASLPVATGIGALRRGLSPIMAWARLTKGSLRLGGPDAAVALDPQSRQLLWHVLVETISAIGVLGAADGSLETGLAALGTLAERARVELAASPPRSAALDGPEPPQIFVLEMLNQDLQPCLGRWQARLGSWRATGRELGDWPLHDYCRADLVRTRERLVERCWQLGMALGLPGLERLLPERSAVLPVLTVPGELAAAEAAAVAPLDPSVLQAGWQIYIETATRMQWRDPPTGPGVLGEAIASLGALADEIRAGLKAMPPPSQAGGDTIQALAFSLLNDGVEPFLIEWRPRYRRFAAAPRPEAKWRRADACRMALAATVGRCLPIVRTLGHKIGAPPLPEPKDAAAPSEEGGPLQLPPPLATRP
jgi:hypothetical protein